MIYWTRFVKFVKPKSSHPKGFRIHYVDQPFAVWGVYSFAELRKEFEKFKKSEQLKNINRESQDSTELKLCHTLVL